MSKLAVVMFRCDGCKKTGEPEPYPEDSRIALRFRKERIPEGWGEMRILGNRGDDFLNAHYCGECLIEVERLLGGMALNAKDIGVSAESIIEDEKKPNSDGSLYQIQLVRFKYREDADRVLRELIRHLERYDCVSVADYYEIAGKPAKFTDSHWGWYPKAINNAYVCSLTSVQEYAISLPFPEFLKDSATKGESNA